MKIALVYASKKPRWVSAQSIRENLRSAWFGVESASLFDFRYSKTQNWTEWSRHLQSVKPDVIVFLESMPVPEEAVTAICKIKALKKIPFIFHIYGDFSINTHKWFWLGPKLVGRKVLWLAASAAQHGQLVQFFKSDVDVRCLPFPVDSELYNPCELRESSSESVHRFLYIGRFSLQKNTGVLLDWAAEYLQKNPGICFDFAGPFDDIGGPLWSVNEPKGRVFNQWKAALKSYSADVRSRIRYHGVLSSRQICALATQSDCYVSLSTFHDEDFGMAPLESLFCGSRAILTGWGGFSSFAVDSDSVQILPVQIKKDRLSVSKRNFYKALDKVIQKQRVSVEERHLRHLIFSSHFGIDAVAERLEFLLQTPISVFTGFNFFMRAHATLIFQYWLDGSPVYKKTGTVDPLYERVYRSYHTPDLKIHGL